MSTNTVKCVGKIWDNKIQKYRKCNFRATYRGCCVLHLRMKYGYDIDERKKYDELKRKEKLFG